MTWNVEDIMPISTVKTAKKFDFSVYDVSS